MKPKLQEVIIPKCRSYVNPLVIVHCAAGPHQVGVIGPRTKLVLIPSG